MRKLKVFVVEDHDDVRASFVSYLADVCACQVVGEARSERESIEWLHHNRQWDVAVVDLVLKDSHAIPVLIELTQRFASQHVVVLSSYISSTIKKRCEELEVDRVFDRAAGLEPLKSYFSELKLRTPPPASGTPGGGDFGSFQSSGSMPL